MSLNELIELDEKFQTFLRNDDYSYIAPINLDLFKPFVQVVTDIAPKNLLNNDIHRTLSNREATKKALAYFKQEECRIFVIDRKASQSPYFFHDTIENYCKTHNIDFEQISN